MTSKQYQAVKQGGPLALVDVQKVKPGPDEVCIRPRAVALNPLDWKKLNFGVMVESWPTVLGIDGAGIVESVGEGVTAFKAGDEVFSLAGHSNLTGSFQELYSVPVHLVAKKPKSLSFEEASTLPICFLTAASAIIVGLKIPLPGLNPAPTGKQPQSILILGGASAVGAGAIQLLRLAIPSVTIVVTASAKHHDHLLSLGASKCLDRSAQSDAAAIRAATPGGAGVDAILDAVTATATEPAVFDTLKADGPKLYSQVITGQNPKVPEGIQATQILGRQTFGSDGGRGALPWLAGLIEEGKFKLPVKPEVVGNGFEAIRDGLRQLMQQGVSGTKLVVSI